MVSEDNIFLELKRQNSLNPCSNGTWSRSLIKVDSEGWADEAS